MKLLALEISTTSSKAQYVDTKLGESTLLVERNPSSSDVRDVCMHAIQLGRKAAQGKAVDCITTAGTWHSLVVCDASNVPIQPLTDWTDVSGRIFCNGLRKDASFVEEYYRESGSMVHAMYPFFKLLKQQTEGIVLTGRHVGSLAGYLHYLLTGTLKETASMLSGMGLLSTSSIDFHPMAKALGCTVSPICDWRDGSTLSKQGSRLLGLTEGIPVLPPLPDGALNQVGSRAEESGVMTLSMGTSGAMRMIIPEPWFSPIHATWLYRSVDNEFLLGAATSGCSNCVDWYKEHAFNPDVTYAQIEGSLREDSATPIFLPFLVGERCPGWDDTRLASFHDVQESMTTSAFYQGVLQGIVANLYQCYEELLKSEHIPRTIKLSGGVLHSAFWKHLCCNYFGVPMHEDSQEQTSLYGALILAARSDNEKLSEPTQTESNVLHSNPELREYYTRHYKRYRYWYEKTNKDNNRERSIQ
ncbi:FGGY-family carbohydrate kinase [uncultured Sphaerochaeta sp.]|uniref:FGGY-family carbohydrate kinase n=1 Tax=uncultured Sphaerochaeta sp. TaxID=886478 RepID=UPI0029CA1EE5|nr:FGGY-family carbohydrate kinase [uncultured Sphaerochaeta sp.]